MARARLLPSFEGSDSGLNSGLNRFEFLMAVSYLLFVPSFFMCYVLVSLHELRATDACHGSMAIAKGGFPNAHVHTHIYICALKI